MKLKEVLRETARRHGISEEDIRTGEHQSNLDLLGFGYEEADNLEIPTQDVEPLILLLLRILKRINSDRDYRDRLRSETFDLVRNSAKKN